jgi:hypothetical protein
VSSWNATSAPRLPESVRRKVRPILAVEKGLTQMLGLNRIGPLPLMSLGASGHEYANLNKVLVGNKYDGYKKQLKTFKRISDNVLGNVKGTLLNDAELKEIHTGAKRKAKQI